MKRIGRILLFPLFLTQESLGLFVRHRKLQSRLRIWTVWQISLAWDKSARNLLAFVCFSRESKQRQTKFHLFNLHPGFWKSKTGPCSSAIMYAPYGIYSWDESSSAHLRSHMIYLILRYDCEAELLPWARHMSGASQPVVLWRLSLTPYNLPAPDHDKGVAHMDVWASSTFSPHPYRTRPCHWFSEFQNTLGVIVFFGGHWYRR